MQLIGVRASRDGNNIYKINLYVCDLFLFSTAVAFIEQPNFIEWFPTIHALWYKYVAASI